MLKQRLASAALAAALMGGCAFQDSKEDPIILHVDAVCEGCEKCELLFRGSGKAVTERDVTVTGGG